MSLIKSIKDFRINIDPEFQGWILCFATVTAVFFFCLPCYCAGLSFAPSRKFAQWLSQRLPYFYAFMSIFNLVFIYLVVEWLPDWTMTAYIQALMKACVGGGQKLIGCATSILIIAAFCIVVAFKDRIAQLLGFDYQTVFRFKLRDCTCFGGSRFRPIELAVWKVEDLRSQDPFSANNVFVEFYLGYNEKVATRVHNNAGSSCTLKELMQLNFDENDEEETLYIFVKNQKVVGTFELARAEISALELRDMVHRAGTNHLRWSSDCFLAKPLIPRGTLYLRASPIMDEDHNRSLVAELTAC